MKVQLLLTGNELMSGDIIDSNSAMMAQQLKEIGVEVKRKVTVSDDIDLLIAEITQISQQADVLIINGGLGPTTDDMTAEALAKAAEVPLCEHPSALAHITNWCEKKGAPLNGPNRKQSILPKGSNVVANSVGSAVGFKLTINDCDIYCTPGVPSELKVMLTNEVIPALTTQLPENLACHTSRFQVFGYGESGLQKLLAETFPDWPQTLEIGYRASMPLLELKITSRTVADMALKTHWVAKIKACLGEHIVSTTSNHPESLAATLINLLKSNNKTITTAESCTGGLISSLLTKEAGASNVFNAGFVTYSNDIKSTVLNVTKSTLDNHGAVSKETVIAMANGALNKSDSDYVIAVSGIAGPDGGTTEKPVGSFWIAWGSKSKIYTKYLQIKSSRWHFQLSVATIGLDLIRREIINTDEVPRYFIERKHK